jgi:hypothetical protein
VSRCPGRGFVDERSLRRGGLVIRDAIASAAPGPSVSFAPCAGAVSESDVRRELPFERESRGSFSGARCLAGKCASSDSIPFERVRAGCTSKNGRLAVGRRETHTHHTISIKSIPRAPRGRFPGQRRSGGR